MIEKVVITRRGMRLDRCYLLDADDVEVAQLPITGYTIASDIDEGEASLEMHAFRVSVIDAEDLHLD